MSESEPDPEWEPGPAVPETNGQIGWGVSLSVSDGCRHTVTFGQPLFGALSDVGWPN